MRESAKHPTFQFLLKLFNINMKSIFIFEINYDYVFPKFYEFEPILSFKS
jgi:hypothetical protein